MRRLSLALFAALLASGCGKRPEPESGAPAREEPMRWTAHEQKGLFRCEVPPGWRRTHASGPDLSFGWTDESDRITATLYGLKGSLFSNRRAFLASPSGGADASAGGKATVAGRDVKLLERRYEVDFSGPEGAAGVEHVYEELVVLPAEKGFWVLKYRSPDGMGESPPGLEVWRRFLEGFRIEG